MPLCKEHHAQFHALLRMAGVNLEFTSDPVERLIRAKKATMIFDWMLTEELQRLNSEKLADEKLPTTTSKAQRSITVKDERNGQSASAP
jgi:hypothetical protein